MDDMSFRYELHETSGGAMAQLDFQRSTAVLAFKHSGMACEGVSYELSLTHQRVHEYYGLLFVDEAHGSVEFPHAKTEFSSSDLVLEYIYLGDTKEQCEAGFDLFLYLAPELSDLLHHKVACDSDNPNDLELVEAISQLDKTRFRQCEQK